MRTVPLGTSETQVPNVVLGLMRIMDSTDDEIRTLVGTARDAGIDFFDHADIYGGRMHACKERFAQAMRLSPAERAEITIQTKCGIVPDGPYFDFSYEHIVGQVVQDFETINPLRRFSRNLCELGRPGRPDPCRLYGCRMSRTLRTVAIALAVLLVGWLAWYLVQPLYLQSKARGDVASGLAAQRTSFENETRLDAALLEPVLGSPRGVRTGYYCEVVHDDSGWIVSGWRQECFLRTTSLYPTTDAIEKVEAAIATLPGADQRFGPRWGNVGLKACGRVFSFAPGAAEVTYRDESCPVTTRPDDGRTTSIDWQSLPSVTGVGAQVKVERTRRISNTELGCAPTPLFCQAPFEKPVTPG